MRESMGTRGCVRVASKRGASNNMGAKAARTCKRFGGGELKGAAPRLRTQLVEPTTDLEQKWAQRAGEPGVVACGGRGTQCDDICIGLEALVEAWVLVRAISAKDLGGGCDDICMVEKKYEFQGEYTPSSGLWSVVQGGVRAVCGGVNNRWVHSDYRE